VNKASTTRTSNSNEARIERADIEGSKSNVAMNAFANEKWEHTDKVTQRQSGKAKQKGKAKMAKQQQCMFEVEVSRT